MPHIGPLAAIGRGLRVLSGGFLDLVYPPSCLGCSARPARPEHPLCLRCATNLEQAGTPAVQRRLARLPAACDLFASVFALWRFDRGGTLQKVQHTLKYGNRPRYGVVLGRRLGRAYQNAFPERPVPDLVVSVPLHRTRRLERGYNQSARLARGVAAVLGIPPCTDVLRRVRPTRSQTTLSRPARWTNVAGAFGVHPPNAVKGRTVLLIDDVLTTGATAAASAQGLHAAGVTAIHLATLALARG